MELATLTGSEKQVAWAEKIRATALAEVDRWIAEQVEKAAKAGYAATAVTDQTDPLIVKLRAQASASWWIDRVNGLTVGKTIIKQVM